MNDQENGVGIDVDLAQVVELLKKRFTETVANLEHQNAMLQVALESQVARLAEAEEDNRKLRAQQNAAPRE